MHVGWADGQSVSALFLSCGIVAGALVGWALGPRRGPAFLASMVSCAALVVLAALLVTMLMSSEIPALVARASLAAAFGFLCGGLTQTLAMA